jgi:hypothetical protein
MNMPKPIPIASIRRMRFMTYHQQREHYEQAFLQQRLDELSPEELAKIQAEIEQEEQSQV